MATKVAAAKFLEMVNDLIINSFIFQKELFNKILTFRENNVILILFIKIQEGDLVNVYEYEVLKSLVRFGKISQRKLAARTGFSLGMINKSYNSLVQSCYIDQDGNLTEKSFRLIKISKPERAIILAAGYGMRMVPINLEFPKSFIFVDDEALIERLIKQLNEADIFEIYIVVGFLKEQFEYLIDKYNVQLIVNPNYALYNNLHSLHKAINKIGNSYIVPGDLWCKNNPFNSFEPYSWYMISEKETTSNAVKINRKGEVLLCETGIQGNTMIGISYISKADAEKVKEKIEFCCKKTVYNNSFWEIAICENKKMIFSPNLVDKDEVVDFNTYEQLRDFRSESDQLNSSIIKTITNLFDCSASEIYNIRVQKKGMTNRSFVFSLRDKEYIVRVPGEGTENLINRKNEADVYNVIKSKKICENVLYINPENGYKITEFYNNSRTCDAYNKKDVEACMKTLKEFHNLNLEVSHSFDIFSQIEFYESLWGGQMSVYKDYNETKRNVFSLKEYINNNIQKKVLTHIDAVPDNFLFIKQSNELESVKLIDWEYAGMQDPHVDIAMFAVYAMYDKEWVDYLIDLYFENRCNNRIRIKIYCYISACGLLWSNWCEYKRTLGVDFGEYSIAQYRYAKDYYRFFVDNINSKGEKE